MAELATVAEEAVKKIDSKLECSICYENFKEPKLLPCFHVFCKSPCLERLVVQGPEGQSLTCPTCRCNVPLPDNGVAGLQTDFHIEHLFEIKNSLEEAKKADCENCKRSTAIKFCQQCKKLMCDKCTEMHQMWEDFRDHRIIDTDDAKADTISALTPSKKILRCTKHSDKKLKIYCETCSELICSDCTIRIHKTHDYDLIKEVFPTHKEELINNLCPLKEKLNKVTQGLEKLEDRITEISDQQATAEADAKAIDELILILKQRKEEILTSINSQTQQKLKELTAQKELVETTQTNMSSCLEYAEAGLETGTEGEVVRMKESVLKRIEEITAEFNPETLQPNTEADIVEIESELKPLINVCDSLKKIASDPISAENSYATGNGMKFAMKDTQTTVDVHPITRRNEECYHELTCTCNLTGELVHTQSGTVIKCDVSQENDRHTIIYQPVYRGRHSLHIRVNGRHIRGSPFSIAVTPSLGSLRKPVRGVANLDEPYCIAVNSKGQVVVVESGIHCVSVLTSEGKKILRFGKEGSEKGQFYVPRGVAIDQSDNIYVVEKNNHRIQKFTSEGKFRAAVGGKKGSKNLRFKHPVGICFNSTNQLLYVCDTSNHRIQVLTTDLTFVRAFGEEGNELGQFQYPRNATFNSINNLYVTDYKNHRIQVFTAEGEFLRAFFDKSDGRKLENPYAIAIDSSDIVYVSELELNCVSMFTSQGEYITSFGEKGRKRGHFNCIRGVCIDKDSSIIVSDSHNDNLQIFNM